VVWAGEGVGSNIRRKIVAKVHALIDDGSVFFMDSSNSATLRLRQGIRDSVRLYFRASSAFGTVLAKARK
jgi:hypothetical protein